MTSHAMRLPSMRRRAERAEPVVTYRRLPPEGATAAGGRRVEPWFADVAPSGAVFDDVPLVPEVEAPSVASLDPLAGVSTGEIRVPSRRRGSRAALIVGVVALVAGAGVLAATFGGVVKTAVGGRPDAPVEASASTPTVAAVQGDETATVTAGVRVVPLSAVQSDRNAALVGGIAPGVEPPVAGEAPGVIIANPPMPRLRPATASAGEQQAATDAGDSGGAAAAPGAEPTGLQATATATPAASGGDVDQVLASVDRVLAAEQARSASLPPPTPAFDPSSAAVGSPVGGGVQPLPYPALEPLPGAAMAQPGGEAQLFAGGATDQAPYGDGTAVEEASPAGPWWLPKRRVFRIPGPTPPADVPNAGGYATW